MKMSLRKLMDVDSRYLYLVMLVLVSLPVLKPLGLPMLPSPLSTKAYQFIESLPAGSVVILDGDMTAGYGTELQTQFVAVLRHVLSRPLRTVIACFGSEGPLLVDMAFKGGVISGTPVDPKKYGAVYGKDYVFLGYIPGGETGMLAFARDSWTTKVDAYGTPLAQLPIMEYCKSAKDWKLAVSFTGGNHEQRIAQWNSAYGVSIIFGVPGVSAPRMYAFMASGQVYSMLSSLGGAAEYELLTREIGLAAALMDVLNLGQLMVVVCVVVSNIAYLIVRSRGEK